ncbi:hypothetical protein EXIGLDRAFT_775828 [Exidia glandulosa HHB12029]|uniref:Uncharacterized protein n=1 Tax=Exidia glandulosa HHB12029 TaxID=1314781 RepID=A0A165DRF2_EXIGL|nr:hypothetical protein EXIGLDRAFT_775828 [Exidia glandulosa HHB12029]
MSATTALALQNPHFGGLCPELLSEIFALATLDQQDNAASYAASSVCRFWRSVALDEPRMWTTLVLDFGGHANHAAMHEYISRMLARAKLRSLTLHIVGFPGPHAPTSLVDLFGRVSPLLRRVYFIHECPPGVYISHTPLRQTLSTVFAIYAPRLEEAYFTSSCLHLGTRHLRGASFQNAPLLAHLWIGYINLDGHACAASRTSPWTSLRSITLRQTRTNGFGALPLVACSSNTLTHLALQDVNLGLIQTHDFPCVERVDLSGRSLLLLSVVSQQSFPRLYSLSITGLFDDESRPILDDFLRHDPIASLLHLQLLSRRLLALPLSCLLPVFPRLEKLELRGSLEPAFFCGLAAGLSLPLAATLRELDLDIDFDTYNHASDLVVLLQTKQAKMDLSPYALESLRIRLFRHSDALGIPVLATLVHVGSLVQHITVEEVNERPSWHMDVDPPEPTLTVPLALLWHIPTVLAFGSLGGPWGSAGFIWLVCLEYYLLYAFLRSLLSTP